MLMTTKLRISSDQHNNIFVFSGRRRSFFEDADEGVFVWIVHKENQLRLSSANFSWYNWGPCLLLTQASGELGPLPFVDPGLVANWGLPFADPGLVTSPRTAWIPKTYRRNFFCWVSVFFFWIKIYLHVSKNSSPAESMNLSTSGAEDAFSMTLKLKCPTRVQPSTRWNRRI